MGASSIGVMHTSDKGVVHKWRNGIEKKNYSYFCQVQLFNFLLNLGNKLFETRNPAAEKSKLAT